MKTKKFEITNGFYSEDMIDLIFDLIKNRMNFSTEYKTEDEAYPDGSGFETSDYILIKGE